MTGGGSTILGLRRCGTVGVGGIGRGRGGADGGSRCREGELRGGW